MGFLNKFKAAFGLNGEEQYDELISDDPEEGFGGAELTPQSYGTGAEPTAPEMSMEKCEPDTTRVTEIFEHVVATFNQSLPQFLQQSVDPEAQKRFLFETLSGDLKRYVESIDEDTRRRYEVQWQNERVKLQGKVRELEERSREIEQRREELNQQKLSAERQRRSLSDRVHDLEKQVMNLEAEKEQYQLESKSMSNKLKVASVHEDDLTALQEEIQRLNKENMQLRGEKAVQLNADGNRQHEKELEEALAELTESYKESERQRKELAGQLEKSEKSVAEFEKKFEEISGKIDDAEQMHAQMHLIEEQMTQFEEIKRKKDNRISQLKAELAEVQERARNLEMSMAGALELQNAGEKELKAEIERLKEENLTLREENRREARTASQRQDLKDEGSSGAAILIDDDSAFDDIFSDTDWVIQQPRNSRKDNQGERGSRHGKDKGRENDLPSLF